ncbi:MAG TPA: GntR family transcriptional regulator [Steroidobacteraceae bacterium]|jgi:DNA-binding GntR family transcriptional regulator|nr:GntR family transcriptional regulator [Steroidobacteraceae bacterium]
MDTALKRVCMRDRIRDVLVARILDGTYPAGQQLKELSLAREFNVSQAPIREALRELEGTGLVTSERYRGTRVRGADSVEMRESYELRLMMEARSIERGLPLSAPMAEKLQSCITKMSDALTRGDSEQYIDWALNFHRSLVEMGGNGTFLKLWDSLHWDVRGRIALRRLAATGTDLASVVAMHARVVQSMRDGDARGAVEDLTSILQFVASVFATE